MRWSKTFIPTMKEVPADAEVPSHQLMLRAGLIRQVMAGAYTYLPLGYRALRKAEAIVREEMDAAGAVELHMPAISPIELFERTNRREAFGNVLMNFEVRRANRTVHLALNPTHEEVVTDLVAKHVSSYRQLPLVLYQIQTKFRNEERPRFGVLRTSEFLMKDAYSFSTSKEQLDEVYDRMYAAYCRIFSRCGLEYLPVEAESGPIGGDASHEFMIPTPNGEDSILISDKRNYAANVEKCATGERTSDLTGDPTGELEAVETPGLSSIAGLCANWPEGKLKAKNTLKTMLYRVTDADGGDASVRNWVVVVRGDHEVNEAKLSTHIGEDLGQTGLEVALMTDDQIAELGGAVGYVGPHVANGLVEKGDTKLVVDPDAVQSQFWVAGANEADKHVKHFNWGRDCSVPDSQILVRDIRNAMAGDPSPKNDGGVLEVSHGIEVGHVFKLGTKYSEALDATFLDAEEQRHPIIMGCYGIGVNRIIAGLAETCHDENGLIWPLAVAPYEVLVIPLSTDDEEVSKVAESLYDGLTEAGVDVLYDDRKARPGAKFKDADLIGIPLRVVVGGRGLKDGVVEVKWRTADDAEKVPVAEALETVLGQLAERREAEAANVPA